MSRIYNRNSLLSVRVRVLVLHHGRNVMLVVIRSHLCRRASSPPSASARPPCSARIADLDPSLARGFSGGVRKILHPAEALDSARQTAELIMKDAMDALIRTKQRLMEILPSLMPSQAAAAAAPDAASKVVENVEQGMLGKAEGGVPAAGTDAEQNGSDEKPSEGVASNASGSNGGLTTNTTTGSVHQSSPDSQSRKKWKVVGLSKI